MFDRHGLRCDSWMVTDCIVVVEGKVNVLCDKFVLC